MDGRTRTNGFVTTILFQWHASCVLHLSLKGGAMLVVPNRGSRRQAGRVANTAAGRRVRRRRAMAVGREAV